MKYDELSEKVYAYTESCTDNTIDEYFVEGKNLTDRAEFKAIYRRAHDTIRAAKKMIADGDAKGANQEIDKLIAEVEKFKEAMMSYDDSFGEALCGNFLMSWCSSLKQILVGLCTLGVGGVVVYFKDSIDIILGMIEHVKSNGNITWATFNSHRMKLIAVCNQLVSKLKKAKADVSKEAEGAKTAKELTKESVDTVDLQLDIFEAFESGNITEEDRDNLLAMLEE